MNMARVILQVVTRRSHIHISQSLPPTQLSLLCKAPGDHSVFSEQEFGPTYQCSCSSQPCSFSLTAPSRAFTCFKSQLHSAPAALEPPIMIRRFRNTGTSGCDTLGGSTDSAFPSQGRASLCRHTAELAAIICWESEP